MTCYLRCLEGRHPDIVLTDGLPVELGRSPLTKIKDKRVSRVQVLLTAHMNDFHVECEHVGGNPSVVGGKTVVRGTTGLKLGHNDLLELIDGGYKYRIVFKPPPAAGYRPDKEASAEEPSTAPSKRQKVSDTATDSGGGSAMLASSVTNSPFFTASSGTVIKSTGLGEWRSIYNNKMLVFTSTTCQSSEKVAAFDIDWTIISTISGKVFPKDDNDWQFMLPEIPGKLKNLQRDGYKIVFVSNQGGIGRGKVKQESFMSKVERIIQKLGVGVQVTCSTTEGGLFRKPRPGIWWWIQNCGNGGQRIRLEESFYCGDAAGRVAGWQDKRKKDFSCSDRLFAKNIGVKFYTPEEYFKNQKPTSKFTVPEFDPTSIADKPLIDTPGSQFTKSTQEMIMMVGIQGSGKSHVADLLEQKGYVVASNDRTGSKEKTLKTAKAALAAGKSVVVDNTHKDAASRKEYVNLGRSSRVPVRCFKMTTSHHHARHNNLYRELVDPSHAVIKEILFNQYRSSFEEPNVGEGFEEIVAVNFVPQFPDKQHEALYRLNLLEK